MPLEMIMPTKITPPLPPPPPSGPKKIEVILLSAFPPSQRLDWIQSKQGLNLNSLKLHYYPHAALIEKIGLPTNKEGDVIPENETEIKEKLEVLTKADIEALLSELFQMNDTIALPFMKKLEVKVKNWKASPYGLNDCHKFLVQTAVEWRQAARKAQLMVDPSDPFYARFQEKQRSADNLLEQYHTLLEQYHALSDKEVQETSAILSKIQENINELKAQKEKIKPVTHQLAELRKALAKAEGHRLDRIKGIENKIEALKLENEILQSAFDPMREFEEIIAKNDQSLEALAQQLSHPDPIVFAGEQQEIDKARRDFQKIVEENDKIQLLQSLFNPPESWLEISKKKVKLPTKAKKELDSTGMVSASPVQEERAFDIQFLPIIAINNLSRFFAPDYQAHLAYMQDKNGLIELMNRINAMTRMNDKINFNYLMDIAQGKMTRPHNYYPSDNPQKIFDKVEVNPSVTPDYTALLARSNRHFNIRDPAIEISADPERAFDKTHFQQYCQDRGIIFEPPLNKRKYYLYHRQIDLDYLNTEQMHHLSRFFEKYPGEFLTGEGKPDVVKIIKYVNDLFDNTGLSFEEVMDIASGHLLRSDEKMANNDPRYALAFDVKRVGLPPDYAAFIKQRQDYLAEQKRLEVQQASIELSPLETQEDEKDHPAASPSVFTPAKPASFPRISPHRALAAQAKKPVAAGELTRLGLRNRIVEMLINEEATKEPISFLIAPERMNMNRLLNQAPRKRGWLPVMEYSSAAVHRDLSALQELCIQLNQSETEALKNNEGKLHVLAFLENVNERAEQDRYYKLTVLKGYLLHLEERYGGPVNGAYYKMGALSKQLIIAIDELSAIGVFNISDVLKDLLDDAICKAEYDHFKTQLDLAKARDEKAIQEQSFRPKRS